MTDTIIQLLGDDINVGIEDIDKYITKQGVVVRVSVGGGRNSYYVSSKIYGVKEEVLSEESKEFMGEHIRDGRVSFVPKAYERRLRAVESKLKKKLKEMSIGYDNSFIPLSLYPEFKEYYENCKQEYFQIRDELVEKYPAMYERFIEIARQSIRDLNAYQAQEELQRIISKIPGQETFKENFKVDMSVSAFPTMENLDMFDEAIKEDIRSGAKQGSNNLVNEATINVISEGMDSLSSIIRGGADNGRIHQRIIFGLKNGIKRMGQKNIFANQRLEAVRKDMEEILHVDADEAIEMAERLLSELHNYARELNIDNSLDMTNCSLTRDELIAIYELYN